MNLGRFTLSFVTLFAILTARPAFADEPAATVVAAGHVERSDRGMHKIAFGVRMGETQFALSAQSLSSKGVPVDDWSETGRQVVPTFCVGGDGYFMKLDFPILKTSVATSYGLGLYPLNFGHLFKRTGLFPFASAGVAASVLTLPGQGISGASAEARLALGLKVRLWGGLALSAEVGYAPYVAAAVVDKQKMHDLVQGAIDGQSIDPPAGTRPARGGLGRGLDFLVGIEWL
jgi:hypothetical protein